MAAFSSGADARATANGTVAKDHEDKGIEPPTPKDDDPDGLKLLRAEDGLERAAKLLSPLSTICLNNIDVWIAIYDVAVRRGMPHLFLPLSDRQSHAVQASISKPSRPSTAPRGSMPSIPTCTFVL